MPDIDLSSSHSPVVLVVSILVAAAIAYLFYRRTLPPVSNAWRIVLGSLRFFVFFLLFYLLGDPLVSLFRTTSIRPSVLVVVDNSRSMTISSASDPLETYASVVSSREIEQLEDRADVQWLSFENALRPMDGWTPDSIRFDGDRTNISGVFEELRREPRSENLKAIILLTDGNSTSASNPTYAAEALGVATFPIGIGDTTERKDVRISNVLQNSIAYAGTRVPVQVTIQSSGYQSERVDVVLSLRGSVVNRSTVTLGSGTGEYRTTLFMTPDSSGTIRGNVSVSRLDGESTYENNRAVFFVTVLSGKRKVLLLAGAPNQDVAFIRRSLEADSNITVTTRIERTGGGFLEGDLTDQLIRESDALFFVGYPGPFTTDRSLRILAAQEFDQKPVFFMLGRRTDKAKLDRIAELLPVTIGAVSPTELQVFLAVPQEMRQHPLLRFGEEAAWTSLPPVFRPQGQFTPRPESQVIGTVRLQSQTLSDPLLVTRSVAGRRSIALLGYGLWRWKMLSPQGRLPDGPFDMFLQNTVQWLTAIDDQRQFRVTATKESFSALEPALFRAEVYDASMRPVSNATIEMTIRGGNRTSSVTFSSIDNGQYEGSGDVLPPGEYAYTATARSGGIELGADRGVFSVGGLEVEFLDTRLNKDLLRSIAFRTGGSYYDAAMLDGLSDRILDVPGFGVSERRTGIQIELAHSGWVLGIIILLLTAEWFLRKRLGLL